MEITKEFKSQQIQTPIQGYLIASSSLKNYEIDTKVDYYLDKEGFIHSNSANYSIVEINPMTSSQFLSKVKEEEGSLFEFSFDKINFFHLLKKVFQNLSNLWAAELSSRTDLSRGMTNTKIDENRASYYRYFEFAEKQYNETVVEKLEKMIKYHDKNISAEDKMDIFYRKIDLLEHYELMPNELENICRPWLDKHDDVGLSYEDCETFLTQVEGIGYTFEYYLDAEPYCLRPQSFDQQMGLLYTLNEPEQNIEINRFIVDVLTNNINPILLQESFEKLDSSSIEFLKFKGEDKAAELLAYINNIERNDDLDKKVGIRFTEVFSDLLNKRNNIEIIGGKIKDIAAESIKNPEYLKNFDSNTQEIIKKYREVEDPDLNPLTSSGRDSQFIDDVFDDIENQNGDLWTKYSNKIKDLSDHFFKLSSEDPSAVPDIILNNKLTSQQKKDLLLSKRIDFTDSRNDDELGVRIILQEDGRLAAFYSSGEEFFMKNNDVIMKNESISNVNNKNFKAMENNNQETREPNNNDIERYNELGQRSVANNGLLPLTKEEKSELEVLHKKLHNENAPTINNQQTQQEQKENREQQTQYKKWKINPSKGTDFYVQDLNEVLKLKNRGAVYNFIEKKFGKEVSELIRKNDFKTLSSSDPLFKDNIYPKSKSIENEKIKGHIYFFHKDQKTIEWRDIIKDHDFKSLNKNGEISLTHVDYLMENLSKEDMLQMLDELKTPDSIYNTYKDVFERNFDDLLNFPLIDENLEKKFQKERYNLVDTVNKSEDNKEVFLSVGEEYLQNTREKNNDQDMTR
ncbi:hypothetical protein LPB90_18460 [Chryseobacterium sp. LC2016-29]|uniref:hypothetical protein n=1 Tax=Chryseobacterium sp. LC2016-29 TaxID=2897331 RepID=UPI001E2ADC6F|nr:hypothetical protein [Chryseobacterium sp. LC2016-29]MCD0480426.1 hypothetical protein [Chryseobacterium sp. LC2016-29]